MFILRKSIAAESYHSSINTNHINKFSFFFNFYQFAIDIEESDLVREIVPRSICLKTVDHSGMI